MCPKRINVPAYEWYGDTPVELEFPDRWEISVQRMAGHDARSLSSKEISEKLQNPIGSPTLRELSRGKHKIVIIFDDMTRPTKTFQLLPSVIEELRSGGLNDEKIRFVMATGAHGARLLQDFRKKLGEEALERFLIFNHNPYENLVNLGETSRGTPVWINKEVMSCDLKVAIGGLIPHFGYGFGGGAKMLLPGVAGIDSIWHNHKIREGTGPGKILDNQRRLDAEEAARMAGIDFSVNVIINADRDVSDLFCGDVVDAHRDGVELGRTHYSTPTLEEYDVSIGNGFPMANEGYKAYHVAIESVRNGGDLVFLSYTPEGCRVHYYNGRFGTDFGGLGWKPDKYIHEPWKMGRVIVVSPIYMKADNGYYGQGSRWVKSWKEAVSLLEKAHGSEAKVVIYPCAAMQISDKKSSVG